MLDSLVGYKARSKRWRYSSLTVHRHNWEKIWILAYGCTVQKWHKPVLQTNLRWMINDDAGKGPIASSGIFADTPDMEIPDRGSRKIHPLRLLSLKIDSRRYEASSFLIRSQLYSIWIGILSINCCVSGAESIELSVMKADKNRADIAWQCCRIVTRK